jgi:hypothetical protein
MYLSVQRLNERRDWKGEQFDEQTCMFKHLHSLVFTTYLSTEHGVPSEHCHVELLAISLFMGVDHVS